MGRLIPSVVSLLDRKPRVISLDERVGDSEAAHELAVTTHRFSKRARAMVDDKLSLSATLMRAGEVSEAQRLLAEAESDLRAEEAALMQQIEELGSFRELHKPRVVVIERPTRRSMFRSLAFAVASAAVIAVATMGGAVIGLFEPEPPLRRVSLPQIDRVDGADVAARSIQSAAARRGISVLINGVEIVLTRAEWRELKRVQRSGDEEALSDLLGVIAPELTVSSKEIIEVVAGVTTSIEGTLQQATEQAGAAQDDAGSASNDSEAQDSSDGTSEPADDGSTEEPADDNTGSEEPPAQDDGSSGTAEDGGGDSGAVQGELGSDIGSAVGDSAASDSASGTIGD